MDDTEKNDASVLVRMPTELKDALLRQAAINKRRITAEINHRLINSLRPSAATTTVPNQPLNTYSETRSTGPVQTEDGRPLTDHDRAVLARFRQLTPEKQLSLLTLLRP